MSKIQCNCKTCEKEIFKTKSKFERSENHFCSKECMFKHQVTIVECLCSQCSKSINVVQSQFKRSKNHFCSRSCSATFNNKFKTKNNTCLMCGNGISSRIKYCSRNCEKLHKVNKRIKSKTAGKHALKTYLKLKNNFCSICNLSNTWENKILVLIMDHIDGNPYNNDISNLRLVCPNCDSQLDTFKGKNKGNGRFERMKRYNNNESY